MKIMKKNSILIILFALFFYSCNTAPKESTEPQTSTELSDEVILNDEQIKILNILTGKIEQRVLGNVVKANGKLDVPPQNLVTISAPLGGFVKYTDLLQGMKVRKGEVIAELQHPDYIQLQQDYLDNKSQLEFFELEYKRQQELAAENVNAAKTLQQAKTNYFSTKAKVEGLVSKLKLINLSPSDIEHGEIKSTIKIIAPLNCYVMEVNVNVGMYVNPNDVMFKLVDTDHLHAEAQVFEKDLNKLKIGQRALITLTGESKPRIAKVYLIGKEISLERTVRVHCHFEKEDTSLIPGMYFSALIEVGENRVNSVPENAIVNFEAKDYLFVEQKPGSYKLVEVKTGVNESGYTEVILPEGFDINSQIVINGTYALISKLKNVEE
jgi:cobalt-zinc-cadmium efflux system membrane fusion protein